MTQRITVRTWLTDPTMRRRLEIAEQDRDEAALTTEFQRFRWGRSALPRNPVGARQTTYPPYDGPPVLDSRGNAIPF